MGGLEDFPEEEWRSVSDWVKPEGACGRGYAWNEYGKVRGGGNAT